MAGNSLVGGLVRDGTGNAYANTVTIDNTSSVRAVAGGVVSGKNTGNAYANTVVIKASSVVDGVFGGFAGTTSTGKAYENSVSITGDSTITGSGVYGGFVSAVSGQANRNDVSISGGSLDVSGSGFFRKAGVYGGLVELWDSDGRLPALLDASADLNTVSFSSVNVKNGGLFGGCVRGVIYPGTNVTADINTIALSNVSATGASVYGGLIESGFLPPVSEQRSSDSVQPSDSLSANGNSVFLEHSSTGNVYGGTVRTESPYYAFPRITRSVAVSEPSFVPSPMDITAHADDNTVGIAGSSTVSGDVHGGLIEYGMSGIEGESDQPVVTVSSLSRISAPPEAAPFILNASANSNKVSINGIAGALTVDGNVYGGIVRAVPVAVNAFVQSELRATADKNTVTLAGGSSVSGNVYGGSVFRLSASAENSGEESEVVVNSFRSPASAEVSEEALQSVTGSVSGNTVRIEGGSSVAGCAYGGYTENGRAEGNFVYIDGTVSGGAEGGHTLSGDASGNTIVMEGGTVLNSLYGGFTADGSALNNVITVKGGRVNAEVVGGYDDGTATGNTVTLYGSADLSGSGLYGGKSGGSSSDVFTGNTLNVHGQIQAASLQNFQNLNFSDVSEEKPSVDLSGSAVIGDGKGSMTSVAMTGLENTGVGDVPEEYVLVHTPKASSSFTGTNLYVNGATVVTVENGSYVTSSGTVANDGTMDNQTGTVGMTRSQSGLTKGFLTFDVDYFIKNGQDLIARTKNVQADHRTKAFNTDRLPGLALVDQGGDLVAGAGMESAAESAMCLPGEEPCGTRAFMTVTGGYSTYKTDTHFNMTSGNAMVGLARYCKLRSVGFLAGVFFEAGLSRFNAEHEYAGYDSFDSDGNASYYGVGALGKIYLNETAMQGLYTEGSFRIGMLNYNWDADGWRVNGSEADYSSQSPYMAAHGGIGWMKSVTDNVDLDIYAKYLWSHVSEDDGSISGSRVNFDAMDSNRLRGGARLSFKGSGTFSWYLGAAYERQFNGRSTSDIYGHDTPSASLTGDTAMVEGWSQAETFRRCAALLYAWCHWLRRSPGGRFRTVPGALRVLEKRADLI